MCDTKLEVCPFCGTNQIEVVKIDMKDPDRDLIKCRHCRGQVMRYHWNERHITLDQAKKVIEEAGLLVVDGRRNGFIEGLATAAASQIGMTIEQFIDQCEMKAQGSSDG